MQLKVIKTDGAVEQYLHTKVIGTISNALCAIDHTDIWVAEQLSEVVTYFLYHERKSRAVTSGEIFSIIKVVLTATGYEEAGLALSDHYFERKLKRCRIEVVSVDIRDLADAQILCSGEELSTRSRWDKSRIVSDLTASHNICRQTARTIASMVEEKIFGMGVMLLPASLIKQLVLSDTAAVLQAQHQLQTV